MMALIETLSSGFPLLVLGGMAVNFKIACIALLAGLALGLLLAYARVYSTVAGYAAMPLIGLMRAAPTFVVMFFLLNAIPRDATLFGAPFALSGVMIVALSLVPYAAAYIADSGIEGLRQWRKGSRLGALLFLPNVTRAFFILVMSSSAGAAIGVTEGITVILRQAERLPLLGDRLALFAMGIVLFGIPLQAGLALVRLIQRRLSEKMTHEAAASSA